MSAVAAELPHLMKLKLYHYEAMAIYLDKKEDVKIQKERAAALEADLLKIVRSGHQSCDGTISVVRKQYAVVKKAVEEMLVAKRAHLDALYAVQTCIAGEGS